jgi:hypothetical protein
MRTSFNILEFDIGTIQSISKVHIKNTGVRISKYKGPIELHGDWGIGSSGLKLSVTSNSLGMLG